MYYLLVISVHTSSSIIIITSLPDIIVKTKHWNQFTADIPSLVSILIYNNSASPILLVYDPSYNVTSPIDLLNNSLFPNDYGIPFLWTSSKNFHHSLNLTLFWLQSTGSPSRQSLSLPMTLLCSWTQHVCLFFMCSSNITFLPMSPLTEAWSLC